MTKKIKAICLCGKEHDTPELTESEKAIIGEAVNEGHLDEAEAEELLRDTDRARIYLGQCEIAENELSE